MLVLTRKQNESIVINDNIEIEVIGIENGKVKLGIKAPKNIEIHRKEVFEAIQNENKEAANNKTLNMNAFKDLFKK